MLYSLQLKGASQPCKHTHTVGHTHTDGHTGCTELGTLTYKHSVTDRLAEAKTWEEASDFKATFIQKHTYVALCKKIKINDLTH